MNEITDFQVHGYDNFLRIIKKVDSVWLPKSLNVCVSTIGRAAEKALCFKVEREKFIHGFVKDTTDESILKVIKNKFRKIEANVLECSADEELQRNLVRHTLSLPIESEELQNLIAEIRPEIIKELNEIKKIYEDTASEVDKLFRETWHKAVRKDPSCRSTQQKITIIYGLVENPQKTITFTYEETWDR